MKDNKEFLEGVYRKAELLEKEKFKKRIPYKRYIGYSSLAAIFIILPLMFFNNGLMTPYKEIESHQPRIISMNEPISNFYESDFILIGEVKEIKDSIYEKEANYIYTDIIISVDQIFLGEIEKKEIKLRLNGGKVKKGKVFSKIEGEFIKDKRSLLFLYKDGEGIYNLANSGESQFKEIEDNIFIDELGNKYDIEDIKKNIDRR